VSDAALEKVAAAHIETFQQRRLIRPVEELDVVRRFEINEAMLVRYREQHTAILRRVEESRRREAAPNTAAQPDG
jgi:BMFP domain-containing protein YqiC